MKAGEMVLYEAARLKHGRPMRLKGKAFGNIFTHFAPMDWEYSYRGDKSKNEHYKPHEEL